MKIFDHSYDLSEGGLFILIIIAAGETPADRFLPAELLPGGFIDVTALALFISCLGILGLSSYTAEHRTKETGIRKVLGATVSNIIKHISKEFIVPAVIANILIRPLAYYIMNQWLRKFAYRISIDGWTFILTGLAVLFVSLLTVSRQILRAARANPADSLRYE